MGVDARMVVKLTHTISDDQLVDASYRLAEACQEGTFWFSRDDDLARGDVRRALNRIAEEYDGCGVAERNGLWLKVSLLGRYYGPGYERGNLWSFIAVAEWLEHNFPGCVVFYGGDCSDVAEPFTKPVRTALIAHWASHGGRPYYAGEGKTYGSWYGSEHPKRPTCPLCQREATQYGSGHDFASWQCDACGRHFIWAGGDEVRAFNPDDRFDSFEAANAMRGEASTVNK